MRPGRPAVGGRGPRWVLEHRGQRLSQAQLDALGLFAQVGGHGYGKHGRVSRPTAESLQRMGLVTLSERPSQRQTGPIPWGEATARGREALAAWHVLREG